MTSECQFLLGTVQPLESGSQVAGFLETCQFLLGTVQLVKNKGRKPILTTKLCQFLLGTVQQ